MASSSCTAQSVKHTEALRAGQRRVRQDQVCEHIQTDFQRVGSGVLLMAVSDLWEVAVG